SQGRGESGGGWACGGGGGREKRSATGSGWPPLRKNARGWHRRRGRRASCPPHQADRQRWRGRDRACPAATWPATSSPRRARGEKFGPTSRLRRLRHHRARAHVLHIGDASSRCRGRVLPASDGGEKLKTGPLRGIAEQIRQI